MQNNEDFEQIKERIIKDQNPKKLLKEAAKNLLKNSSNGQNDEILDIINKIDKIEIPDEAALSLMEQVEKHLNLFYDIRFNTVSVEFEYKNDETGNWEKLNENEIYRHLKKHGFKFSMSDLMALLKSNYTPKYNPFEEYFKNLPSWDGQDHISKIADYIHVGDQRDRFTNMLLKWMVRSIACGFEELFNKQAIVIIGSQNNGKSSFLRWLCPPKLRPFYKEDLSTDKDSKIALSTNFIINIDELSTMMKKDINAIKSLMSTETVKERIPYDRSASVMKRHANFVASTDRGEFLSDEAGSVRWVCFYVDKINWDYSKHLNIDQLWAQAYNYYLHYKNEKYNPQLTRDEIEANEKYNLQFYQKGAEHEAILHLFTRGNENDYDVHLTSTQIVAVLKHFDNGVFHNPKMSNVAIGKALKLLQFTNQQKYKTENRYGIKGYYLKFTDNVDVVDREKYQREYAPEKLNTESETEKNQSNETPY